MRYVLAINNQLVEWPYSERKWREENPNISMRKWADCSDGALASVNVYRVEEAPRPEIDERTQHADRQAAPALVDGVWVSGWIISAKPQADIDTFDAEIREHIKIEAGKRIVRMAPEWKQRNAMARGLEFARKMIRNGPNALTPEEDAEEAAMDTLWMEVKRLRAVSDQLEAMDPPPQDFDNDRHWTP